MAMEVRPGSINPLSTMKPQTENTGAGPRVSTGDDKTRDVKNLQIQQETLRSQVLLMKSSSDSSGVSADGIKLLEKQMEEVAVELKTAKSQEALAPPEETPARQARPRFDRYEPGDQPAQAAGTYQIRPDEEKGYQIMRT